MSIRVAKNELIYFQEQMGIPEVPPATESQLQACTEGWKGEHLHLSNVLVAQPHRRRGLGRAPAGPPAEQRRCRRSWIWIQLPVFTHALPFGKSFILGFLPVSRHMPHQYLMMFKWDGAYHAGWNRANSSYWTICKINLGWGRPWTGKVRLKALSNSWIWTMRLKAKPH